MRQTWSMRLAACSLASLILAGSVPAFALGLDPALPGPPIGPEHAKGVIVWSHGRSINAEDYKSPTPPYLRVLRQAGWDVLRFDRLRDADTLSASTRRLVADVDELKAAGYRRIVLAGQSFGAFLSLMAADRSSAVDAVVATAPAAYGSFEDFYGSWRRNASRLYPLLAAVKRARVMLFYFHGDDYDPGGRGARSRAILTQRGLGYAVISEPQYLIGHWAASSGLFLRRFGGCIRDFLADESERGSFGCTPRWGEAPSAALVLPPELRDPVPPSPLATAPDATALGAKALGAKALGAKALGAKAPGAKALGAKAPGATALGEKPLGEKPLGAKPLGATAADGSGVAAAAAPAPHRVLDTWYGFYPNGREVLLAVEDVEGTAIDAVYAVGPSVDDRHKAEWTRRSGSIEHDELVFATPGESTLRFRPSEDGGLAATWIAADGSDTMVAHLRPIPQAELARPLRRAQPQ